MKTFGAVYTVIVCLKRGMWSKSFDLLKMIHGVKHFIFCNSNLI